MLRSIHSKNFKGILSIEFLKVVAQDPHYALIQNNCEGSVRLISQLLHKFKISLEKCIDLL